jgi:hypothetical protein
MSTSSTLSRCSGGGGIPLLIAVDTRTPSAGAALVYRAGGRTEQRRDFALRRHERDSAHRGDVFAGAEGLDQVSNFDAHARLSLGRAPGGALTAPFENGAE